MGVIAKIRLAPTYSSWQDRKNGIYLTQRNPEAEVLSTMDLDFIKNAVRQKVVNITEGYIDLNFYGEKFIAHKKINLDNTWPQNQLIIGPTGDAINGIKIGDKEYEFKGDLIEPGPMGPIGHSIEYNWNGTQLGVRTEGETDYAYSDLIGPQGIQGIQGERGIQGPIGLTGLQGPQGERGPQGTASVAIDDTVTNDQQTWSSDKISKRVTVDGESKENIDFMRDEVVQDGLVTYHELATNSTNPTIMNTSSFTVCCKSEIVIDKTSDVKTLIGADGVFYIAIISNSIRMDAKFSDDTFMGQTSIVSNISDGLHTISVSYSNKEFKIYIDNERKIIKLNKDLKSIETPFRVGIYGTNFAYDKSFYSVSYYNRILMPSEIAHNLQVLNSSPSINGLTIADSTGAKTSLLFSNTANLTTMDTGYNVQEFADSVMDMNKKEFVADSTGKITVDNGMKKSKVLGAEIKGNTVKNEILSYTGSTMDRTNNITSLKVVSNTLKANTQYTLIYFIKDLIGSCNLSFLGLSNTPNTQSQNGVVKKLYTPSIDSKPTDLIVANRSEDFSILIYGCMIIEGDWTNKEIGYFTGLSSTQAIISNNGQSYPLYEPTIQGKTENLNGQLVSLEPTDSSLPKLGSASNVTDTLDLANRMIANNTYEEILNSSNTKIVTSQEKTNTILFSYTNPKVLNGGKVVCNILEPNGISGDIWSGDNEDIEVSTSGNIIYMRIQKTKLPTNDLNGFISLNPVIRYQLATPTTQQLTPEQLKAYDPYKRVILTGGVSGIYDTLEIKDDGSGIYTQNTLEGDLLDLYRSIEIHPSAPQINTVYVQGAMNINGKPNTGSINTACNSLTDVTAGDLYGKDVEGVACDTFVRFRIEKNKLSSVDLNGIKKYLTDNKITVRYQLAAPIVTSIPKSLIPTIPINKTNILSVGGEVAPSEFKATIPVDRIAELQTEIAAMKQSLISLSEIATQNSIK